MPLTRITRKLFKQIPSKQLSYDYDKSVDGQQNSTDVNYTGGLSMCSQEIVKKLKETWKLNNLIPTKYEPLKLISAIQNTNLGKDELLFKSSTFLEHGSLSICQLAFSGNPVRSAGNERVPPQQPPSRPGRTALNHPSFFGDGNTYNLEQLRKRLMIDVPKSTAISTATNEVPLPVKPTQLTATSEVPVGRSLPDLTTSSTAVGDVTASHDTTPKLPRESTAISGFTGHNPFAGQKKVVILEYLKKTQVRNSETLDPKHYLKKAYEKYAKIYNSNLRATSYNDAVKNIIEEEKLEKILKEDARRIARSNLSEIMKKESFNQQSNLQNESSVFPPTSTSYFSKVDYEDLGISKQAMQKNNSNKKDSKKHEARSNSTDTNSKIKPVVDEEEFERTLHDKNNVNAEKKKMIDIYGKPGEIYTGEDDIQIIFEKERDLIARKNNYLVQSKIDGKTSHGEEELERILQEEAEILAAKNRFKKHNSVKPAENIIKRQLVSNNWHKVYSKHENETTVTEKNKDVPPSK